MLETFKSIFVSGEISVGERLARGLHVRMLRESAFNLCSLSYSLSACVLEYAVTV
jgi:hypothetical protein